MSYVCSDTMSFSLTRFYYRVREFRPIAQKLEMDSMGSGTFGRAAGEYSGAFLRTRKSHLITESNSLGKIDGATTNAAAPIVRFRRKYLVCAPNFLSELHGGFGFKG